jgi:histone H3/H4
MDFDDAVERHVLEALRDREPDMQPAPDLADAYAEMLSAVTWEAVENAAERARRAGRSVVTPEDLSRGLEAVDFFGYVAMLPSEEA